VTDLPIFFYLDPANWPLPEVLAGARPHGTRYFVHTPWNWILQTYFLLRDRGRPVELANVLPDEGIVVLCTGEVPVTFVPGPRQFLVSINADNAPDPFAQMRITQNRIQTRLMAGAFDVPHWPQPDMIRRDPERGDALQRAAYFGDNSNLCAELKDGRWRQFLADRGIDWDIRDAGSSQNIDFSDVDLVIGVRSFQRSGYIRKPPTKLFNAWIAGAPALLGAELAFREWRRSDLDYLEVTSFDALCAAVDRLVQSPQLRRDMIVNGHRRAEEVTPDAIIRRWEYLLFDVARERAARWVAASDASRRAFVLSRIAEKKARGATHRLLRVLDLEQYAI
jgi:hypothetical protein